MTFQWVENQYHAAIAHDRGPVKLLAVLQTAGQWLNQDFHFADEAIRNQAIANLSGLDNGDRQFVRGLTGRPKISASEKTE